MRIKIWLNRFQKPLCDKLLIDLAEEGCLGDIPKIIEAFGRVSFRNWNLTFNFPFQRIGRCFRYLIKDEHGWKCQFIYTHYPDPIQHHQLIEVRKMSPATLLWFGRKTVHYNFLVFLQMSSLHFLPLQLKEY